MTFAFFTLSLLTIAFVSAQSPAEYEPVKADLIALMDEELMEWGPMYVRLAWHSSGTYDQSSNLFGSNGGTIGYYPELGHGANAGLYLAVERLNPLLDKYPFMSCGDLFILAGITAWEHMGGPELEFTPGRGCPDVNFSPQTPPEGNLPNAHASSDVLPHADTMSHIRDIFGRMGFNDKEIVALVGVHVLGKCHKDRSGYDGPWTANPTRVNNAFYTTLLGLDYANETLDNGVFQYRAPETELMMLPADLGMKFDSSFSTHVAAYAASEEQWRADVAPALNKLFGNGVSPAAPSPSDDTWLYVVIPVAAVLGLVLVIFLALYVKKTKKTAASAEPGMEMAESQ